MAGTAKWSQVTDRMIHVGKRECANRGVGVMTIEVMVDSEGDPIFWSEPKVTRLEPRGNAEQFMRILLAAIANPRG